MKDLINRNLASEVEKHLQIFPAVAILGSRQCGKSTLIRMLAQNRPEFILLVFFELIADILLDAFLFFPTVST